MLSREKEKIRFFKVPTLDLILLIKGKQDHSIFKTLLVLKKQRILYSILRTLVKKIKPNKLKEVSHKDRETSLNLMTKSLPSHQN